MNTNDNTQTQVSDEQALAIALKATTDNLQSIQDSRSVDEAVYGWLKSFNISIHEDASEQLCGVLLAIVERARAGKDRPTDADVRAALENGNKFALEHNAEQRTKLKLRVLDLSLLPDVLVK
jgi:hypothetical protein